MNEQKIWTKDFISISLVQFIIFIGFYTLLTTLPIYVIKDLNGSEAQGGLVVTIMLFSAIIMRPISGLIIDKLGKKSTLLWSTGLYAGTMLFYFLIDNFIVLMVIRFLHGLSFGVLTTIASAIAADVVPKERKGAGLGYFGLATNIAMIVGPFLGLTLIQFISFKSLFIFVSMITLISVICALVVKVPKDPEWIVEPEKKKFSIQSLIEVKALPIALFSMLVGFAYASILSYVSVFAEANDLVHVAGYFFIVFAIVMIVTRPYFGNLFDLKGPKYVIVPCLIIYSVGLILLSYSTTPWLFLIAAAIIGLGSGTLVPSFQTMCIIVGGPGRSGYATATFYTFWDIGIATGSYVLGLIVSIFNFQVLYISCAVILIIALALFIIQQSSEEKKLNVKKTATTENI